MHLLERATFLAMPAALNHLGGYVIIQATSQGRQRLIRVALLGATLALAPLTLSTHSVGLNNLSCSEADEETGTCCQETASICNAGGGDHMDYYYKTQGCCSPLLCPRT